MKSASQHPLVRLLSICGQVAEHKSEKVREHGKDEAMILAALSPEEQEQLQALLEKLQQQWLAQHRAHHQREA